jgi:hypothetical protein
MRQSLTIIVVLLSLGGCYDPDLSGPGGFSCAKTGECPAGFNCVNGVCLGPPAGDVGQQPDGRRDTGRADLGDARAPDTREDGPAGDGPVADLPTSDLPVVTPGSCVLLGKPQEVSTVNATDSFSFAVSAKGVGAVSFAAEGTAPTLNLLTRAGTSFTSQTLASNAGDDSAVAFDTSGNPFVAYHDLSQSSLKVWFNKNTYTVDSANVSGYMSVGATSNTDYRIVTYSAGGALKRAFVRINPAQSFTAQISPVGAPTGVTGGTHLAQGVLLVSGTPYTLAYLTTEPKPRVIHSIYYTLPSPSWKHYTLDTITGLKLQDYGVDIAPAAGGGPPIVWSNVGGASGGPQVRYHLSGKTVDVASGTSPSYAVASGSHEAVAYLKGGSIELISRKTGGQGTWTKPLVVYTAGVSLSATKVIVQGNPNASATTATWELVYRVSGNMTKLRRLHHVQVSCKY